VVEGQRLLERVVRAQDRDALARLAEVWDAIVTHPDFDESSLGFRLALLNRSGVAFNWRGQGRSNDADNQRARARFVAALAQSPPGWPDRPRYQFNLGMALMISFAASGNRPELEAAVENLEQAVRDVDPEDAALASLCRHGLANALAFRYRVLGTDGDLDRAARLAEESVRSAPPGSGNLPGFRSELATILGEQYDVHGALDDLRRAIELLHANLDAADGPAVGSEQARDLNRLGDMLRRRYLRTHQVQDLEDAISFRPGRWSCRRRPRPASQLV
jgi:tetratricopeptide (TPR) repeat protein